MRPSCSAPRRTSAHLEALAAEDDLTPYHVVGNTRRAHELLARDRGAEDAAWERIDRAHFGAQPVDTFLAAMEQAWRTAPTPIVLAEGSAAPDLDRRSAPS